MTLIIRDENEKSYLRILKYLFEQGDEDEIKKYILDFPDDDPDYDVFIEKLQDFARNDNIEIIEEMIYDEDLTVFSKRNESDFDVDEEVYEQYLYSGEYEKDDPLEEIPNAEEEFDIEYKESKNPRKDLIDFFKDTKKEFDELTED